jgi:predicted MPP superfamily phosphohydrolase
VLAALAVVAFLYATVIAPRRLRVTTIDAPIRGLSRPLDGYTLAVLSDIHYGATARPLRHIERAAALARAAAPDMIVMLGDYGLSHSKLPRASRYAYRWAMRALEPVLRTLHAPDGVIAVLGNHDYEYDGAAVAAWLRAAGVRVLVNQAVYVDREGARLAIGGVDDLERGTIDPTGGCADVAEDVPRIVLSHHPDGVLSLAPETRVDLVLSGHTHGGQVVLPVIGALLRRARLCGRHTAGGWIPNERVPLYVSRGVGVIVPVRVGCPPEVVIVRLRAAPL